MTAMKTAKRKFGFRTALVRPRLTRKHPTACGRNPLFPALDNEEEEITRASVFSKAGVGRICEVRGRALRESLLHAPAEVR